MALSRRRLLQVGAGGAALLAIGGAGIALQPSARRAPPAPLKVLGEREYAILAAVAEGLLPPREGLPSVEEVRVAWKVDQLLATMHPAVGAELSQALLLLENGLAGLLLDGRPRPLSTCDVATRTATLDRWRTSAIPLRRTVFAAVSGLVGATYWADPRTYAFVGYPGPPAWLIEMRDREDLPVEDAAEADTPTPPAEGSDGR